MTAKTISAKKYEKKDNLFYRISHNRIAYAFIAPAVIAMFIVHLIPTAEAVYMSFLDVHVQNMINPLAAPWIGLENYQSIISGLIFGGKGTLITDLGQSIQNSFWFTFWVGLMTPVFSLIFALLLNREFRGRGVARTFVLLPRVVPTFAVGIVWQFIWAQQGGLANRIIFSWLHLVNSPPRWLLLENARAALIIPAVWRGLPFTTVMLLATLQVVPTDLYEAASIDGANNIDKFRFITWPYLIPIIAVTTLFGIVFNFFGFGPYNIAVNMFNSTNDLGKYVNLVMIVIVRQTFQNNLYGYGAAASVLMMIVALIFTGLYYRTFRAGLTSE